MIVSLGVSVLYYILRNVSNLQLMKKMEFLVQF